MEHRSRGAGSTDPGYAGGSGAFVRYLLVSGLRVHPRADGECRRRGGPDAGALREPAEPRLARFGATGTREVSLVPVGGCQAAPRGGEEPRTGTEARRRGNPAVTRFCFGRRPVSNRDVRRARSGGAVRAALGGRGDGRGRGEAAAGVRGGGEGRPLRSLSGLPAGWRDGAIVCRNRRRPGDDRRRGESGGASGAPAVRTAFAAGDRADGVRGGTGGG